MSFNVLKSVVCNTGRLLSYGRKIDHSFRSIQSVVHAQQQVVSLPNRFFTRSLWHLCKKQPNDSQYVGHVHRVDGFPKMCGCCGLHTEGDKEMAEFLTDEIKLEKDNQKAEGKLPQIKDFELTSTDGADVVLTQKSGDETVCVRFNVNHSVDDNVEFDEAQDSEPDMMSRPAFTVEVNKGGQKTLAIQCQFPAPEASMAASDQQETYDDTIEITEVTMLDNNEGKWEDNSYTVSGHIMDGNLYDMLLNLLEERGIDGEFVNKMTEFSTAYEQQQYVKFLETLKDFSQGKDC